MRCGGHDGHHNQLSVTRNHEGQRGNTVIQISNDSSVETKTGRVYESCIGSGCSRSPSPLRREFWQSNKPLPDIVIKRKEQALQNRLQAGEENEQQPVQEADSGVASRQGRPRIRIKQSRDPLFVYNDASESGNGYGSHVGSGFGEIQVPRYHTPSPRRPRASREIPNDGDLTLDVNVTGETEGLRVVSINNSCSNSPRSVKLSVNDSPRVTVNDCPSQCCPAARSRSRSPSPRAPCSPCQLVDRASSPVSIRSRSRSPRSRSSRKHSRSSSQGRAGVNKEERTVNIDEDDGGNLHIQLGTSDEKTSTCPIYTPWPALCCRNPSRSSTPTCRSVSPNSGCRSARRDVSSQNSIEISSDDGDVQVKWEGNDASLQVDLENSGDCTTPRRVNIRHCSRSPPKSRSRSRSRSPDSRTPRSQSPGLRSPKSRSPTAARSPDPNARLANPQSLEARIPWDNTTLPTGTGALRLNRPPPLTYKSRSPSKSRSRSPTSHSRTPSPYSKTPSERSPTCRTPRKFQIHHSPGDRSRPVVEVDHEYISESVESHTTPQTSVCHTPCRSRCSTPCSSQCSTKSRNRSTTSGSRSRSPRCIQIRRTTPDLPQVTIHRDHLPSSEGSRSRSEPPSSASSRSSSPRVIVRRPRSTTPPQCIAIATCVSNSLCRPVGSCHPCEPVSRWSSCSSCCSSFPCLSPLPLCHGQSHHPSSTDCNYCHQFHSLSCYSPCSVSPTSEFLSCQPSSTSCIRACRSTCHRTRHCEANPNPYCTGFCPAPGDIIIRTRQRQPCSYSGKDDGQVGFFSHRSACGLREGDTIVRLGRFDPTGIWCISDVVGMYMLGSHGLWVFLGEEEGHECLRPVQTDQHQIVRTVNKWFRPRLGDLVIHTLPGPHSFYFWNPKKRLDCDDTRLLLRAYIGVPQVGDENHSLACCTASHLPVGYAELYVNVRNHWLFLGRDDHMFTECEITGFPCLV